jgi:hypothetical protein
MSAEIYAAHDAKHAFPRQAIVGESATFGPTLLIAPPCPERERNRRID